MAGWYQADRVQQYRQRLEGHLAEAELHEAVLDRVANLSPAFDAMMTADTIARPFVFLAPR